MINNYFITLDKLLTVVRIAIKLTVLVKSINQYLKLINISASLTVRSNFRRVFAGQWRIRRVCGSIKSGFAFDHTVGQLAGLNSTFITL